MSIEVVRAGTMTTVQDWPGRLGLWHVGVPPSGPMDDRSFRFGNIAVGNPVSAPGLECTLIGPKLRFTCESCVCVTGGDAEVTLDGVQVAQWEPFVVQPGAVLEIGRPARGLRTYLLVAGGLLVVGYLGSAATFTLGRFGGHHGRALMKGDELRVGPPTDIPPDRLPDPPVMTNAWRIAVTEGPHAAPEFFTESDIEQFYAVEWEVHFNSSRTGVRLVGPAPNWARSDGGEAGLHPSNIHDTPYSVGAVDFTGDVPILLGPDGPSLGGFVCPATVVTGERWKLGQLRPGDSVRFVPVSEATAATLRHGLHMIAPLPSDRRDNGVLGRRAPQSGDPAVTYRRTGDDNLLIEYGPMQLDIGLRMRIRALATYIEAERLDGLIDLTPGIRSLQLHVDPDRLSVRDALSAVMSIENDIPATAELVVPSRTVELPLSWDDPATREAIARYMSGVRDDAPWCPWNIEFIRRINGLATVDDVREILFGAEYLVLGLGDVYLGAPVATPLDPRHRLITTKYNPARTWTPENAVGIGGAYMCIYGMEGPGGYQFVGRTVQVWNRDGEPPWLLREFDRIRWVPVSAEELLEQRALAAEGRLEIPITERTFRFSDHAAFLASEAPAIEAFRQQQATAFAAEREAWEASGELTRRSAA